MKIRVAAVILLILCVGFLSANGAAEYPDRDISTIVVWGAGGGTDTCNRVVMAEMADVLGVNINVNNVPGGVAGSAGMIEAFNKPSDGYTICGLSESCVTAAVMGGWDQRMNVWDYFIIGGSPDVLSVTPDSPYDTIEELIAAAKADPEGIRAGAGGAGSIHHLNLLAFEKGADVELNFIPYDGSAPSQNAAMTGEITVVVTSVAEQAQLIRSGQLKPLAMLIKDDFSVGDVSIPSGFKSTPALSDYLPISQAIGFAVKKDVPEEKKVVLRDAFKKAMESEAVQNFGRDNYYVLSGATGEEAAKVFDALESNFAWTLDDLGSAQVDPASLGIPKP